MDVGELVHLRRARDLIDREYARPLNVPDTVRDRVSKGSLGGVIFETDDCRATFEQVRARGAEVLKEPIEQPYGVIDCAFRDPSGNMIRFSEPQPPR